MVKVIKEFVTKKREILSVCYFVSKLMFEVPEIVDAGQRGRCAGYFKVK